jgi:hypothetical protein
MPRRTLLNTAPITAPLANVFVEQRGLIECAGDGDYFLLVEFGNLVQERDDRCVFGLLGNLAEVA